MMCVIFVGYKTVVSLMFLVGFRGLNKDVDTRIFSITETYSDRFDCAFTDHRIPYGVYLNTRHHIEKVRTTSMEYRVQGYLG